jgi:hypothetical protein
LSLHHANSGIPHRQPKAYIGHHGHDDGAVGELTLVGEIEGEHGQDLVAVDQPAEMIDGHAAVTVAIIGDAGIRLMALNL